MLSCLNISMLCSKDTIGIGVNMTTCVVSVGGWRWRKDRSGAKRQGAKDGVTFCVERLLESFYWEGKRARG